MIALFDPAPPALRWCRITGEERIEGSCPFGSDWSREIEQRFPDLDRAEAIGYKLYHGGREFRDTASRIDRRTPSRLSRCLGWLPEYNDITAKIVRYGLERSPAAPQVLFCETAFFAELPEYVSSYALPLELRRNGIRKYGGHGVGHSWSWRETQRFFGGETERVISVCLGNNTSVAAILRGRAVETSIGFTPAEGMPTATGCGSIDPTIIFQLRAAGFSFEEINRLLTRESGFTGLRGSHCSLADLLANPSDPELAPIYGLYRYRLMKYIGAFIPSLGGVDAIVFFSEMMETARDLVIAICRDLAFLGVSPANAPGGRNPEMLFTGGDSRVRVLGMPYDVWSVMAREATLIGPG